MVRLIRLILIYSFPNQDQAPFAKNVNGLDYKSALINALEKHSNVYKDASSSSECTRSEDNKSTQAPGSVKRSFRAMYEEIQSIVSCTPAVGLKIDESERPNIKAKTTMTEVIFINCLLIFYVQEYILKTTINFYTNPTKF